MLDTGPACASCLSTRSRKLAFPGDVYSLYECHSCDLQFFDPVTNPGARWYEDTYQLRDLEQRDKVGWNHQQFLADRRPARGRLLDVGCGTGAFLAAARERGFEVTGLDFDHAAVRTARDHFGISDIHAGTLDEYLERRPSQTFDVVTAFEILEHVERPRDLLRQCASILRPGGVIAVSVPFRDRRPASSFDWDEPPNHLSRWSKRSLVSALTATGFEVEDVRTGWMAGSAVLMSVIRLGIASGCLQRAQVEGRQQRRRLEQRAARLHRLKTAAFVLLGVPVDLVLRAAGSTGIDMYAIGKRSV